MVEKAVGVPVNVLALRAGPSIAELADAASGACRPAAASRARRTARSSPRRRSSATPELREYAAQNLSSERSDAMLEGSPE